MAVNLIGSVRVGLASLVWCCNSYTPCRGLAMAKSDARYELLYRLPQALGFCFDGVSYMTATCNTLVN